VSDPGSADAAAGLPAAGLPDGSYDVFVVDATVEEDPAGDATRRVVHLELTVIAGEHKSEIVTVAARGLRGEDVELLGMPGTLTVTGGRPAFTVDSD
jgi:uncharacterized protein YcnI